MSCHLLISVIRSKVPYVTIHSVTNDVHYATDRSARADLLMTFQRFILISILVKAHSHQLTRLTEQKI